MTPSVFPSCSSGAEHASVSEVYRSYGISDYERLRTTIFTRIATESEAGLLLLRPGQSVPVVQKIDVDPQGKPIGFSEAVWAGARVQFTNGDDHLASVTAERTKDV